MDALGKNIEVDSSGEMRWPPIEDAAIVSSSALTPRKLKEETCQARRGGASG